MPSSPAHSRLVATVLGLVCAIFLQCLLPAVAQAQDIPGRRLDDIYINVRFHDGYWEWYHQYLQERDEQRQRIMEIRLQLAVIAAERKKLRADWLRYLYLENQLTPKSEYDPEWGPLWQLITGASSATELATGAVSVSELGGEMRREIDDIAFRWTAGLWGAPLSPETVHGRQLEASYQGERDILRTRINEWKEKQRDLIDEALRLNRALAASCRTQKEKSGTRRPWLNAETERLDDELIMLEVQLYDAAHWYLPDELPALVEQLDLDNTATEEVAVFLRAKVKLAQAAWNDEKNWLQMTSPRQTPPDPEQVMAARVPRLEAIVDLRHVIELNPEHAEARGMLMEQELYWLREIAAKVDLESRASLQAFQQYLTARGFYADQPQAWYQHAYEVITAVWGLGPIALTAGLPGLNVAEARAIELDVTQTSAARNQVSLLAIMRLVKNGALLTEIPTMTPDDVAERMTMHTAGGQPLPADKARAVVQDMIVTFDDLDDLRLLASADPQYLVEDVNRAFGKIYYAPLDPTYTWYESFGDLLNLHNVALLWGPGAVAKINGEWAGLRYISGAEIQAAEQAGQLITGRQLFLSATGLDRLAETIMETSVGARLGQALAADREAMMGRNAVEMLANMGGRLSAALIIYSGAAYLGKEAGIPGVGLLTEIIGEIGPAQMLSDVAFRIQLPRQQLAARVGEFGQFLQGERRALTSSSRRLEELSDLGEEISEGAADASRSAAIQTRLVEIVEEVEDQAATRPPGSVAEPVDEAVKEAAEALQSGNVAEARQAIEGAAEIADEVGTKLDDAIDKVGAASRKLRVEAEIPSAVITSPDEMKTLYEIMDEGSLKKAWRPDLYADTGPGRSLQLGEEAIQRGDLEEAAEHFRAARREILETGRNMDNRAQLDYALDRLDDVVNAQNHRRRMELFQSHTPPSDAGVPIDDDQANQALTKFETAMARAQEARAAASTPEEGARRFNEVLNEEGITRTGGANPVYLVPDTDDNYYFVKQIVSHPDSELTRNLTPEQIHEILASEAACSSLAQRVDEIERSLAPDARAPGSGDLGGLNTPATRYVPERRALLSRAIPRDTTMAGELWNFPEHVALAYKKEYARQRVIRAWLGDTDGHLRNMLLGDDARLYQIDFDQAVLKGTSSRHMGDFESQEDFLTQMFERFAGLRPEHDREMYRMMAIMDQMVSYDDMAPTVAAIKELVESPGELERILTAAGHPDVQGVVQTLTERANALPTVLEPMFSGRLLEFAWLRHLGGDWLASFVGGGRVLPWRGPRLPIPAAWPLPEELPRAA